MAAGVVTLTILDGGGFTRTAQFWSSDGTITVTITHVTVVIDATGAAVDYTAVSPVDGFTAAGATLVKNPLTTGGLAKTALPTAVSDAQAVNATFDKYGRQIVRGALRELIATQTTTITASTSETTIVTADAANKLDIYRLVITNSSALDTVVTIKDGTAGTTRWSFGVKAGTTAGFSGPSDAGMSAGAVNTNWTATSSVSVTSLFITAEFVKAGA